ncbi:butyrophilin subfamily 1 member A1-like [Trichomycterus rosablanca]|uniref:butyrophilin subfamily 1 member A1-like n=1 Tax=Trichomycterus rosablanca TaxID=2290929 RepID=UPI002F355F76
MKICLLIVRIFCINLPIFYSFVESQSERLSVVGPIAHLVAVAGEDLLLPCLIQPTTSAVKMRVEWYRSDKSNEIVHAYENKIDKNEKQAQSYKGRTSLFKEELQNGNTSLKLSALRGSDGGTYRCFVEFKSWYDDITVQVTVEAVGSHPAISIENFGYSGGINLLCESKGWNPEPRVEWLDREGADLPAEATQTHKEANLFSVKRHVTVYDHDESNRFYCRFQQKHHMVEADVIIDSQVFDAWRKAVISISLLALLTAAGFVAVITCFCQKKALQRTLKKQDIEKKRKYEVDVTLDPESASPKLILSEDGKQVKHGDKKQDLPDTPVRFDHSPCVLGNQGFSERFYYEIQVGKKIKWDLGVATESVNRKGQISLSPENGFWTVVHRLGNEYRACLGPSVPLNLRKKPEKVGVFVDYEEGRVSFYDVGNRSRIYSFTGQSFTEKLYPFFSPCNNEHGRNSDPLIILPV